MQCGGDDSVEHVFLKCPMSQVAWEVVQEFLQGILGKDFRLSIKNIIMGVCNKKGLDGKDKNSSHA